VTGVPQPLGDLTCLLHGILTQLLCTHLPGPLKSKRALHKGPRLLLLPTLVIAEQKLQAIAVLIGHAGSRLRDGVDR